MADKKSKEQYRANLYKSKYSMKLGEVQYEPKDTHHKPEQLFRRSRNFDSLIDSVEDVTIKEMLNLRAAWFCEFNYSKIADYYAYQATPEEQRAFESLGLVLLDYNNAIKNGFAKLMESVDNGDDYE